MAEQNNESSLETLQDVTQVMNADFEFETHSLLHAALKIEAEINGLDVDAFNASLRLQQIVIESKLKVFNAADKSKLVALLEILYQQLDYQGDWRAFYKVENALLSQVFERRKGIPISLGILLLDILERCGFKAQGICFPSGFIVAIHLEDELVYLDPFTGELPSWNQLELKVRGQLGDHARLNLDMLKLDSNENVIKRYIHVLKAAYVQAESVELALVCSDIILRLDPDDAYEVRDRGFLFQQLNCLSLACDDFEFFIQKHPQDPLVKILKKQIQYMSVKEQVIH
ncbi:hypothetical protein PCNPT3_07510 [Psychromonas sp. CNPT3]|uniref:SirB1 family protein n=1 Tax=Psychromonas sp. CNPT3 TaxID=314282 RepID=UPI00006E85B3|nr:tetratricopeptide repeat protein [Psychromonas sp. CNPT3]AGH81440.1 hypothetical protein PCNPT3_07510 [Psychromonas sp. CNPT3]